MSFIQKNGITDAVRALYCIQTGPGFSAEELRRIRCLHEQRTGYQARISAARAAPKITMEHIQEKSASVMAVEAKQAFFAPAKAKRFMLQQPLLFILYDYSVRALFRQDA
ncbi:MAG: hypothetical protein IKK00_01095 [Oscillospiraceae bacterium]|nr:hypothetical protein [Oscillospiraceae bacterium]